ncbi:hypothetical protein [Nocardia cerradoensis]|nr:hypothetical protein [Nocardia cerradoensis]NKY43567.1 hypothetical protein [Nocardia cerradoensis]
MSPAFGDLGVWLRVGHVGYDAARAELVAWGGKRTPCRGTVLVNGV